MAADEQSQTGLLDRVSSVLRRPLRGPLGQVTLGIGEYLVALVLLATVPLVVFILVVFAELKDDERAAIEKAAQQHAASAAHVIERQLHDMATALRLLATAPELESRDLEDFHNRARLALAPSDWFALLVRPDGQQLLNTRVPFGQALGPTSNIPALERALASRDVHVSDGFLGRTSGNWVFNVILPLTPHDATDLGALILTQNASVLAGAIGARERPRGWQIAIVDSAGVVLASTPGDDAGKAFAAPELVVSAAAPSIDARDPDGTIVGTSAVDGTGWMVVLWGPADAARLTVLTKAEAVVAAGGAVLLFALLFAVLLTRHLRRATRWLSRGAGHLGRGEPVPEYATGVAEFNFVVDVLRDASSRQRREAERIALVVAELSHRMKNLLMVIHSLVQQAGRHSATVEELQDSLTGRIATLSRSVDLLTDRAWESIGIDELLRQQFALLPDGESRLEISGASQALAPEAAHTLNMIFHELTTNAQKYGALSMPEGRVHVSVGRRDDTPPMLVLHWIETGGPKAAAPERTGFGSRLIRSLTRGLGGSAQVQYPGDGARWEIVIPVNRLADETPPEVDGEG